MLYGTWELPSCWSFQACRCQDDPVSVRHSRPFEGGELPRILCACDHLTLLCQMATALITVSCLLPFQLGISSDVRTHTGWVRLQLRLHGRFHYSHKRIIWQHTSTQTKCEFISWILKIANFPRPISKQQLVEGSYRLVVTGSNRSLSTVLRSSLLCKEGQSQIL